MKTYGKTSPVKPYHHISSSAPEPQTRPSLITHHNHALITSHTSENHALWLLKVASMHSCAFEIRVVLSRLRVRQQWILIWPLWHSHTLEARVSLSPAPFESNPGRPGRLCCTRRGAV
uniref:Uncharacterized protein n=1 Tax=Schistocephalus solidus TaxID=70667 RepID=A0A0X3NG49_SCHSO